MNKRFRDAGGSARHGMRGEQSEEVVGVDEREGGADGWTDGRWCETNGMDVMVMWGVES